MQCYTVNEKTPQGKRNAILKYFMRPTDERRGFLRDPEARVLKDPLKMLNLRLSFQLIRQVQDDEKMNREHQRHQTDLLERIQVIEDNVGAVK